MGNHPGGPARVSVPGPHRSVALQDERDRIEAAERREQSRRSAALIATCTWPFHLLAFAVFHWESRWDSSWIALVICLLVTMAWLWIEWFDAVDEMSRVLQEENRLLPNRLG